MIASTCQHRSPDWPRDMSSTSSDTGSRSSLQSTPLDASAPPVLLLHGEKDTTVPVTDARRPTISRPGTASCWWWRMRITSASKDSTPPSHDSGASSRTQACWRRRSVSLKARRA